MHDSKVGVFDSGLGGLTVVKEIKKLHPDVAIVYLGDTARIPYGTRSPETVQKFAMEDAGFLESQQVSQIIIACHTASALAYDQVKQNTTVPVLEMVNPAATAAQRTTKNKRIGIMGTRGTINSHIYRKVIPADFEIIEQACPLLVPMIEEGETEGEILEKVLQRYLQPLKDFGVDTIVMACTHYPIIASMIQSVVGPAVTLVNPGEELAKTLKVETTQGEDKYFVTDLTPRYQEVAERFLGVKISPELVQLG